MRRHDVALWCRHNKAYSLLGCEAREAERCQLGTGPDLVLKGQACTTLRGVEEYLQAVGREWGYKHTTAHSSPQSRCYGYAVPRPLRCASSS